MLSEVSYELSTDAHSKECKRSPQQFIPARFPLTTTFNRGRNTQAEVFDTGHGPFRALIVSNLKWGGPCRGHYVFPAGRYQIFHNSLIKVH